MTSYASYPVEINRAPYDLLLKVPGIGPKAAQRITKLRQTEKFSELKNLKGIGAALNRAKEFILINGNKPAYKLKNKKSGGLQLPLGFSVN